MTTIQPRVRRLPALAFVMLFSASPAPAADEPSVSESLRQGLYAEEVKRDPEAAAKHYAEIIAAEDRRRATVATALFRLAEVRRGQGNNDEAIALYQRLLTEFPQAEAEGKLAREHLAALGASIPQPGGAAADPETAELARLQAAATRSPDLVSDPGALAKAAQQGWLRVAELLLGHGANPHDRKENAFEVAVGGGHLAICQAMVAKAGLPPEEGARRDALDEAISGRRWTVLRYLLEQGIHPDAGLADGSPTELAAAAAREESEESRMLVKLLLENGADPNAVPNRWDQVPRDPPLHGALRNGRFQHATLLLESGAKPDPAPDGTRPTSLHLTAARQEPEAAAMVARLIRLGAKVNALAIVPAKSPTVRSPRGVPEPVTPLQVAVDGEHWDSAKALIAAGANLKQPGLLTRYLPEQNFDNDPADEQRRISEKDSLQRRINTDRQDEEPNASLVARLRFLLQAGADPNILDPRGYHPLALAVLAGRPDLVELLLKHGADPDIPFGKDPGELPPPPQRAAAEMRNAPGILNYGFNPDWRVPGCTPEKQVAMLRLLLKAGAKPAPHAPTLRKLIDGHDPDGSLARALGAEVPADSTPPPDQHQ